MQIIIKNGKVIDGTGNPWYRADIGIEGERIVKIGKLEVLNAEKTIDAKGLIVCPGFVDIHSHADGTNFINPKQESSIRQGITTHVAGNCGSSLAPINPDKVDLILKYLRDISQNEPLKITWTTFREYLNKIEEVGIASNMIVLVGHGTVRIAVMGFDNRAPTENELEEMKSMVSEAMEAGALGLSTGLFYPPGIFAKTEEIIELCKTVAQYHGIYCSHIRSYGTQLMKSIRETIKIGKQANIPIQISHISIFGKPFWGSSKNLLEFLEKKRAEGLEITTDLHPYDSIMTDMQMLLPPWVFDGGKVKTLERLRDPETREKIKHDQIHGCEGWDEWYPIDDVIGWENVLPIMLKSEKYKALEGKNLKEIAELDEKDLFNAIYDVLIEEDADASMIITHLRGEEDIINFIKSPLAAFETDTSPTAPYGVLSQANTHPRGYGTYPKFFGEFVREKKVISLEEAIRKSTSFPSQISGILDRGILRPGFWADVVIFNPDIIKDTGSYANPHQYPIGIEYVLVNGEIVIQQGEHTGHLPGKVLRHGK